MISEIKVQTAKQIAINKVDEVKVMKSMLNDPDFSIGIYDKKMGYVGQRCPHNEAVSFVKNVINNATGLDSKDSMHLAENYEFTNKDANFMLTNMRDFLSVYTGIGRKINIVQNENSEAYLFARNIPAGTKTVPDKLNPGSSVKVDVVPFTKIVSTSKCPKYK